MPALASRPTTDVVSALVTDLDTKGFACIPGYFTEFQLRRMQSFVDAAMVRSNNQYVHFNGAEAVAGSGLEDLAADADFRELLSEIYERGVKKPAPRDAPFYQVLRCLSGQSGQRNSLIFHYDSYVITALVPIRIPESGATGDLLMYPNTRGIRKYYWMNVLDKVLLDNVVSQKLLRYAARHNRIAPKHVKMTPGNLYVFWGYRSIHTNEPCDPDKVRATALFHLINPHKMGK